MIVERLTYDVMKADVFGIYYDTCRNKIKYHEGWTRNESELGYAYYESDSEDIFETRIECLMWHTLYLILDAGRGPPQARDHHLKIVQNYLSRNNLDDLLRDVPAEEAKEFVYDLEILGLLTPGS